MKSNLKVFLKGILDVSPLMIPVVPFGLIFGVLAIDVGFSPLETMGMSLIVFGGASQIVLLQLFSGGASSLVIISSVGAVNSRHLLYGAVVSEHVSDLKGFKNQAAEDYSVSAIPQNFLIDPDGVIVATNLREEGLHQKLAEIFDK